ncbi:MAG: ATP-binding cassette domain-containing protein [Lachnospiraceae bacterium]|nr:ATP-binding cassette domain-containing protein [Lachnospiraceae bacterium]
MIYVKDLSLKIKNETILSDINLHIEKGKITGLVGRNGCGKTMLMKCITGFVKPTSGEVVFNEKRISEDIDFPKDTGIIIETPSFIPYYSGRKNLLELASLNKKIGKKEIDKVLEKVGLYEARNKMVRKYSLGMRQRLGIAQALMEEPETLILDEPMNGLDNDCVEMIRKILSQLKEEGKTILLVSHNKEDIRILCDEIYEMDKGKICKGGEVYATTNKA